MPIVSYLHSLDAVNKPNCSVNQRVHRGPSSHCWRPCTMAPNSYHNDTLCPDWHTIPHLNIVARRIWSTPSYKACRTWWNKTEIKHLNCFGIISIFFNTVKLLQCFSFRDVRTSEIKLQLNNAADGRLYFTHPRIPETEIKQNCRWSAEKKPRPSAVLFYFGLISPCATGLG